MQHKSFAAQQCPIARSLERVGEWWSILILRDVLVGLRRFDQLQKSLDIAPNMLARRLNSLVEAGLLERRRYSERPLRYEYLPTDLARDFRPVMWTLLSWGNRHFFPEGPSVVIIDKETGARAEPIVVDRISGRPMTDSGFCSAPGPAADERTRRRYEPASAAGEAGTVTEEPRPPKRRSAARKRA
jgi:DNA-binding HxlR family transcriptional regulator